MIRDYNRICHLICRVSPENDWFGNIYETLVTLLTEFGHSATCKFRLIWSTFIFA